MCKKKSKRVRKKKKGICFATLYNCEEEKQLLLLLLLPKNTIRQRSTRELWLSVLCLLLCYFLALQKG